MTPKYILKPLTENSWLLLHNGDRLGLVNEIDDKITVMGKLDRKLYESFHDLEKHLGEKIIFEEATMIIDEPVVSEIGGFPVKHSSYDKVSLDPVPNYTRSKKTKARYAAGYYALKFPNGWAPSFCPRLITLVDYDFVGPFTTKLEMTHQISIKNKETEI